MKRFSWSFNNIYLSFGFFFSCSRIELRQLQGEVRWNVRCRHSDVRNAFARLCFTHKFTLEKYQVPVLDNSQVLWNTSHGRLIMVISLSRFPFSCSWTELLQSRGKVRWSVRCRHLDVRNAVARDCFTHKFGLEKYQALILENSQFVWYASHCRLLTVISLFSCSRTKLLQSKGEVRWNVRSQLSGVRNVVARDCFTHKFALEKYQALIL